jgi:phage gp36-like protein
MPSLYASSSQYLAKFGKAEAVQLLADEEALLTETLLVDAIAVAAGGTWTGTPSAAEQAAGTAALARLARQLTVSSNFMDGYLRSVVTLPLPVDDANATTLEDCCLTLARCGLADDADNATERMDKCCAEWRAWLKDVAAGRTQLITPAGDSPAPAGRVRSGQALSGYDWGRFGGVRL